ncbi:nickel pincer cofactor biosynthesis protein LarB [bacterium]|nr:nickel pincer cofactor biosynthesis protein LarB [bacterium]MBU1653067.1 nickel pincer cofactor biosynthesis protein LarB [bacterium]MBU1881118.1 nickel pincer cofactor biosynthesis protein LarB [bacterium]
MTEEQLIKLLQQFKDGRLTEQTVLDKLKALPFEDLEFAKVDHHRSLRRGFPEVIYGEGKTTDEILRIAEKMADHGSPVLITRLNVDKRKALSQAFPTATTNDRARTVTIPGESLRLAKELEVNALVLTAGTSDAAVAEEAAVTVESFGYSCDRIYDVGVAGLHRLLSHGERIKKADAIAVVAGMEGALPSVVGGLVDVPVIAVPTSIGYGANFGGVSALLGMLTGCAGGVAVVNIDNGFAAGFMLATILRNLERKYQSFNTK